LHFVGLLYIITHKCYYLLAAIAGCHYKMYLERSQSMTIYFKYRKEFLYCYSYDDLQPVDRSVCISNGVFCSYFRCL